MTYYSLKYKDIYGETRYYMNIGFETHEAARREYVKLFHHKKELQLKGITIGSLLASGDRIPLCMYDFKIVERKGKIK